MWKHSKKWRGGDGPQTWPLLTQRVFRSTWIHPNMYDSVSDKGWKICAQKGYFDASDKIYT